MAEPDELLLGFARALRTAGVRVTEDRAATMLAAVAKVGMDDERATHWAARAALCSEPDDLAVYDRVFHAWFHGGRVEPAPAWARPAATQAPWDATAPELTATGDEAAVIRARASDVEVLRHRDVSQLSQAERARVNAMFASLRPRPPLRTAYRYRPWRRGRLDRRRTLRGMRDHLGEPIDLAWQHRARRPRRVVLLVDVSGSMSPYGDALLRLAHRFCVQASMRRSVEVFTVGTRLTRVTRGLRQRDPDLAIAAAGEVVPDWSGGTRLGETLKAFLDRWGQRGLARGAVVVVFSDGWERGDPSLLGVQMQRLSRLAHRVIWVNPHKAGAGYEPVQRGIVAALPHCDAFVAGHSLAAFGELTEVIAHA